MGFEQKTAQEARHIRNAVVVNSAKTLTLAEMEGGTVAGTFGSAQALTLPDLDAHAFFAVAVGGQTVTMSGLYDASAPHTATNGIVTKLSGLCLRVKGVGWFCISAVKTS